MTADILPRAGCGAVLLRANCLLLVYRKRDPERDYWGLPGGKVEPFEPLQQAVRREIFEETGLQIERMSLLCVVDQIAPDRNEHWIAPVYIAEDFTGNASIREPEALGDVKWFPLEQLPDRLTHATQVALQALQDRDAS
ncbi:MAG: NUDIX domain-containing protein [Gluconobacter oxydans]|uniref:NUDIX hydrolase n=1 Tax=Gluconobacter oxydans TaxID=442 RepID=UPI0039E8E717